MCMAASACSRVSTRSECRHDLPRAEEGSVTGGMIRTSAARHTSDASGVARVGRRRGGSEVWERGVGAGCGSGGWERRTLDAHRLETRRDGGVVLAQVGRGEVRVEQGRRASVWRGDLAEEGHHRGRRVALRLPHASQQGVSMCTASMCMCKVACGTLAMLG